MNEELEKQLIASWLLGFNKQDMALIDGLLFYPEIQRALSKSNNIVEVAKLSKYSVKDLVAITTEYVPTFYRQALRTAREHKLKNHISALASNPKDFKERISHIVSEMDKLNADTEK